MGLVCLLLILNVSAMSDDVNTQLLTAARAHQLSVTVSPLPRPAATAPPPATSPPGGEAGTCGGNPPQPGRTAPALAGNRPDSAGEATAEPQPPSVPQSDSAPPSQPAPGRRGRAEDRVGSAWPPLGTAATRGLPLRAGK
ncbi:formin-like protein 18 [Calypte anna]|uniref:formin-like protein 18 n=1 Tax=Calypte anna TaxID=9244 RepID=UPI0011C48965|nr:formin-like protein 18 [Calypte anna]